MDAHRKEELRQMFKSGPVTIYVVDGFAETEFQIEHTNFEECVNDIDVTYQAFDIFY
jgi:hypothetical protein